MSGHRWVMTSLVSLCALMGTLLFASAPVLAGGDANVPAGCSNESSPGFRVYLPDCRGYEMVTPPYKQGFKVSFVAGNDQRVVGVSLGTFAGAENSPIVPIGLQGAVYEFTRVDTGWSAQPLTPPASRFPYSALLGLSGDLRSSLFEANEEYAATARKIWLRQSDGELSLVGPDYSPEASVERANHTEFAVLGASSDLTHVLTRLRGQTGNSSRGAEALWPGDTTVTGSESLYEYSGIAQPGARREPVLVGVENDGALESEDGKPVNEGARLISQCGTLLGGGEYSGPEASHYHDAYNAISANGSTVFFTAAAGGCEGENSRGEDVVGKGPTVEEVYARTGADKTIKISEPELPAGEQCEEVSCSTAERKPGLFQGASEDGSKAFFMTEQSLLNGDAPGGMKLYGDEIANGVVTHVLDISHDPHAGEPAEVQGVARVSEDGSYVYFVARGVLTEGPNVEGKEPVRGADNLYVYEPDPENTGMRWVAFVGTLMTEAEEVSLESEAEGRFTMRVEEGDGFAAAFRLYQTEREAIAEVKNVWSKDDARPVEASPEGRFLVFASSAHLTPDSSGSAGQIFEYDAQSGHLVRVSIGAGPADSNNGNVDTWLESPKLRYPQLAGIDFAQGLGSVQSTLTMSDDGSRVFFTSAARLTSQAISGTQNVYEYREGHVYLISDGQDASVNRAGESSVDLFGTDPTGEDVFLQTTDQLVPQDSDEREDIYDAHENGGFPAPTLSPSCAASACQGPLSATPFLPAAGTGETTPGDRNMAPSTAKTVVKPKSLTRAQKLANALKACGKKAKKKRAGCKARARRKYGGKTAKKVIGEVSDHEAKSSYGKDHRAGSSG